jgi:hypothetical protein
MPQDLLEKLSQTIGRKVEPVKQLATAAGPVNLEKVLGRPVKTAQLPPLVSSRFDLYSRARQNGFDSKRAANAAMTTAGTIGPWKPSLAKRAESAFGTTQTGRTVEDSVDELGRMWKNANEKLSNPFGGTDADWEAMKQEQQAFFQKHLHGSKLKDFAAGAATGTAEFGEEMLSPYQIMLMVGTFGESALARAALKLGVKGAVPAARTVSKLMQLQFTSQMLEGAATGVENTIKAVHSGDWEAAGQSAIEGLASGLMAKGLVGHEQAEARVRGDLEKKAREVYGVPQGTGVKAAITSRFDQLSPYEQGNVIDATVKATPEYQDVLKSAEDQDNQAKDRTKKQRRKKLDGYYGSALEQSWEPNVARRTIDNLERSRIRGAKMDAESARKESVRGVIKTIREAAERRSKAINDEFQTRRQAGVEERPERRRTAAEARTERGKLADEIEGKRDATFLARQEAQDQAPDAAQRHVEAVRDDQGNVSYPALYWGEDNSFGVGSDVTGHSVYRQTPRGVEWMDAEGNFSETPDKLYEATDPETADTLARLSSLTATADSMAEGEGGTEEQKKDAEGLAQIKRELVNGEISPREAQKRAGIAEKITLSDAHTAARDGQLTGPYHDSNAGEYLTGIEREAQEQGMSDEDIEDLISNAGALARQQTEANLHHVYRPGDYVVSKRGVRWTLDSKGMLHPDDGGAAVPLMKQGFYSNQAMQLAESGRVGYGTKTREERRADAARRREVEESIRENEEQVKQSMQLAVQREGLQTAAAEEPRADIESKRAREARRMSRPPRPAETPESQIVRMIFKAPSDAQNVINSIARTKNTSPEEVMRLSLATDPEMSGTTEQKVAGLEVGDRLVEPIRKSPWIVEEGKGGKLYLRSGNAQPLVLDRLNPSDTVRSVVERSKLEKDISPVDVEKVAFQNPHYVRWQDEQMRSVEDRATGKVKDPEPKTPTQAVVQAQGAHRRATATQSVATIATIEALEPKTDSVEKAEADVQKANEQIKTAEEAYAQAVEAIVKTEPRDEFPQKAPVGIGLRGDAGTLVQNNREVPFHYELVPLDSLTVSHEWQGNRMVENPRYPSSLQPRTISDSESTQNALRAERGKYDFRQYADKTINGAMGPAIVDQGGQGVGGNTRLGILRKHVQNLEAIPDVEEREAAMQGLKAAMRRLATESGISRYPDDGKFYAVVRMLDEPIRDTRHAAELGRLFNKKIGVQINKAAQGVSYSRSFDESLLEDIGRRVEVNDGIIPAMESDPDFFRDIVVNRFGVTSEEDADWFREVGQDDLKVKVLHEEGRNQFIKALLGTVVKDTSVLNRIEGTTPYRGLERALGYVVKMRALPTRDISEKIIESIRAAADTKDTDPALSTSNDRWRATYQPDQQELLGMETENPPEPDRMVEAMWRANNAGPRTLNDRLKSFIGEESSKGGWLLEQQVETPVEAFNRAFSKELREVAYSRGDRQEGLSQDEFDAALKNRELSDQERDESSNEKEVPEKSPERAEAVPTPEQERPRKMEPPPPKPNAEEQATSNLAEMKTAKGYVTPLELKEFLETNPTTQPHVNELMRTARMMAEYVFDTDPPVGWERKNALDWILQERVSRLEQGELKTKRGAYSDPLIEKGLGMKVLALHKAADASTFIHEFAHVIFPFLSDEDLKAIDTITGKHVWDGDPKNLKGESYARLSEKLGHGLEQFLRDENPTGFTAEVKKVLAKVKDIMKKVYMAFKGDPLSEFQNTEESRGVFAKMFGITDFDVADDWRQEVKKARAEERRMKKPSEERHPLVKLANDMGATGVTSTMGGKVEDSVGERVDPKKPSAILTFGTQEEAATAAWAMVGRAGSKIQNAELIQSPEGQWGIRFNTTTKPPADILNQALPPKHPGLELEDLQKRLNATPSFKMMERRLLQLKIDNLKNRIRAEHGAELPEPQSAETVPQAVREEVKRGRDPNSVRTTTHGVPGNQKPQGPGRISKPPVMGMPGHAGTGQRGGAPGRPVAGVRTSLKEVTPVALQPMANERGTPVGTLKGQDFDAKAWADGLKKAGLPENAPPPTWALSQSTAQVLKYPGQKQITQMALSALDQGDGFVLATPPGSGKTFTSMAVAKEYRDAHPDALILTITKNRSLKKKTQRVAANSFGMHVETDIPEPGVQSGTYAASYMGLLTDRTYRDIPWDLVIADESGEARNWYQPENQQGKMLKDIVANSKKALYLSATPFHSPMEYGYLDKLNLWPKNGFDKWIEGNFAHEKVGDKIVARLDPAKQTKLREQLIERGQMVSQSISYDGMTAHFGVVPVTDAMKRSLDRIREGFARAREQFVRTGKKGMAEKTAAFEATYTKAFLERERIGEAVELARRARQQGWQVIIFSETSSEDLFRRPRSPEINPSTYQELDDAMDGQLTKIIPPFENVYDRLRAEFGDQVGDYSGRGNTMAERDKAINEFLSGKTPMLYSTYAAGGIGVDMHDADYPELNIKGGDKPRVAIFLGPPYSGVLLEQAMGRPWRLGVKSDTHLVFLATDSEPDIRLMQTKVGPRMRALRAAVMGERDSLANVMQTYTDDEKVRARQDMLAYAEGDEMKVNAGGYQVRPKSRNVGIQDWSNIQFPAAETAKNKGMKYGEDVAGGDWSTLFQAKFGMRAPDSPEDAAGKKVIDEMGNAAASGKILQNLDPAEREVDTALSAATATEAVEVPVDRDKKAVARQSMEASLKHSQPFPYYGLVLSQELGMENIARRDGKPEVGKNLKLMNRSYRADYDHYRGQYWNMLEDILKQHKLKAKDDVIREISYVMEGKRTSDNPAITAAAADISDMMRIAHGDMAKAGVRVVLKGGEISYNQFPEDPNYFPHRIDWDYKVTDPVSGKEYTLRETMKQKFDDQIRRRILESIPDLKPYSYSQVYEYLARHEPHAPILGNVHRAREVNFPYIRRDYQTLIGYFDQVGQAIAAADNFGPKDEKLNEQINKLTTISGKNTLQSMFNSVLRPQEWSDWSAKLYNAAIAYEAASKMTFSAFKVPFHLGLVPIGMAGRVRPLARAIARFAIHPREVMENAAYVGTLSRQLSAADIYYGERVNTPVRQILRKEMFESAYKMVRSIAGESAKVYLEQYAMNDMRKGGRRAENTRRLLKETFLIGDQGIDEAVRTGQFSQEDLAKAQTAFANLTAFSDDPLQMPKLAREEIARGESLPSVGLKRAVRLTYALQSFSLKATSLLREKLWDEVMIHHNYKPLGYFIVASPIIGQMLSATGAAVKGYTHRGLEGLEGKQHTQDLWDKYLANLEDTFGNPDVVKMLKFVIDGYTLGYGWDMVRTVVDPFIDFGAGNRKKAGTEFAHLVPDLVEHLVGGFVDDVFRTGKEVGTIGQIESGQKHPELKDKKVEKSLVEYGADQVPAAREVPWVDEKLHEKIKPQTGRTYY